MTNKPTIKEAIRMGIEREPNITVEREGADYWRVWLHVGKGSIAVFDATVDRALAFRKANILRGAITDCGGKIKVKEGA